MSRTTVAAQTTAGAYPVLPYGAAAADFSLTANDGATDLTTPLVDGKTMIIAYNSDSGAHTITINSVADQFNRTGDVSAYSIGAGKIARFGPFRTVGWGNAGALTFDLSDPKIRVAVLTLP
jgi:hypothetical protein